MDLVTELRVFIAVARSGGFTTAAAQLDMPRPTISLAIKQLETRLATRLFNRTTRRVSLSQDGATLLDRAIALVADAEELEQSCRTRDLALTGRLRISAPSRLARRQLAPALPDFFLHHPQLEVELGGNDGTADLVRSGIDCALRVGTLPDSSLVARKLGNLRMINCASPAYLRQHGIPQSPADLDRHQAILYTPPGEAQSAPWAWTDAGIPHALTMHGQVTVDNAETYVSCALAGLGLIQIPAFDVQEDLKSGALVEILPRWVAPAMPLHLVYPHRRHLSRRLQVFSDWLANVLAPIVT